MLKNHTQNLSLDDFFFGGGSGKANKARLKVGRENLYEIVFNQNQLIKDLLTASVCVPRSVLDVETLKEHGDSLQEAGVIHS